MFTPCSSVSIVNFEQVNVAWLRSFFTEKVQSKVPIFLKKVKNFFTLYIHLKIKFNPSFNDINEMKILAKFFRYYCHGFVFLSTRKIKS